MLVLLFSFVLITHVAATNERPATPEEWAACPHSRLEGGLCVMKYADLNNDSYICWEEVVRVKADLLTVVEKIGLFFTQPDDIMRRCAGPDDLISREDFEKYTSTCLRNCEAVERLFKYLCNRAAERNYKGEPVECKVRPPTTTKSTHKNMKAAHHRVLELSSKPHVHRMSQKKH